MKTGLKIIGIFALAVLIGFVYIACKDEPETEPYYDPYYNPYPTTYPVTGITLNTSTLSLTINGSATLTATVAPLNASNKNITWSSSNTAVATVNNGGVVSAVAAGIAAITVRTTDGGYTATCAVTVSAEAVIVPVTGVTLTPGTLSLNVGGSDSLSASIAPFNATNRNLNWTSSNANVATIYNGTVTAVSVGISTIIVSTVDGGYTATCTVYVDAAPVSVSGVTLNTNFLSLTEGGSDSLTATVMPSNAANKNVTWSSSNDYVAAVNDGTVSAVGVGTATISVTTVDNWYTAYCTVTVSAAIVNIPVTGVTLNKNTISLTAGNSETFTHIVMPNNATNKAVTWGSSNASVATVTNGTVTAVETGTANITVTTVDGNKTAICTVTVTVPVTGVTLNKKSTSLALGSTETFTATVSPLNASNKNLSWSSSNTNVATVNNGTVTAVAVGTAIITVTTADGNKTENCTVTVTVPPTGVTLNKTSASLTVGESETLTATVEPSNATNKNVTWSSSNTSVATVNNGVVTAKAVGTAIITVTTADGNKTATYSVTVDKPVLTGTVSITGTAQRGQTLTANTTSLGGSGTISYQWRRGTGTTNIGTNSTYTVQPADVGYSITVIVTRANNSGDVRASTVTVIDLPVITGTVSITGTAQRGQTLSVNTNSLTYSGALSYQWRRGTGTTNIGTSSTYTLQQADVGYSIKVIVTSSGNSGSVEDSTTTVSDYGVLTGEVTIDGTAQVGQTLTANTSKLLGSGTISYQWQRGSTNIGTNSSTYTIQATDVGSAITVIVTRSGNSGSVTSPSIMAVSTKGTDTNPYNLVENVWMDGSITTSVNEVWYSFTAAASTTYRVWWNESGCDGTKTLDVRVRAYNSSGTELFNSDTGWGTPQTINVISGGTIYLRVTPWSSSNTGTFAIGYSTGTERSILRITPPANHTSLTANQWSNGSITASIREVWYSFNTVAGTTTYGVWWDDLASDAVDVMVRAYDSNGSELFNVDVGWPTASIINISSGGIVYLRVIPKYSSSTGAFRIMYSNGFVRPDVSSTTLTSNVWSNGSITAPDYGEVWYLFTAAASTTYRIWWNESGCDGTKTLDVRVRAYNSSGTELFNSDTGWSTPQTINVISGGTIYLRVTPWNSGNTGTFAIVYSTGTTRP